MLHPAPLCGAVIVACPISSPHLTKKKKIEKLFSSVQKATRASTDSLPSGSALAPKFQPHYTAPPNKPMNGSDRGVLSMRSCLVGPRASYLYSSLGPIGNASFGLAAEAKAGGPGGLVGACVACEDRRTRLDLSLPTRRNKEVSVP